MGDIGDLYFIQTMVTIFPFFSLVNKILIKIFFVLGRFVVVLFLLIISFLIIYLFVLKKSGKRFIVRTNHKVGRPGEQAP